MKKAAKASMVDTAASMLQFDVEVIFGLKSMVNLGLLVLLRLALGGHSVRLCPAPAPQNAGKRRLRGSLHHASHIYRTCL